MTGTQGAFFELQKENENRRHNDDDLSEEESDDDEHDDELVQLGQENTAVQLVSLEASDDEEEEAHSKGQLVPLIGSKLGVVSVEKEENEDLTWARLQAISQKLFVSSNQPSPSTPRLESRPLLSSPLPLLNPRSTQRNQCIVESEDRRRQTTMIDPDMPMLVASQAFVSKSQIL